ncbi:MAG TPA: choice-of-anchor Q domain-containing protein [Verrucomicrobiae bacterium]
MAKLPRNTALSLLAACLNAVAAVQEVPPVLGSLTNAAVAGGEFKFSGSGTISITTPIEFTNNAVLDANGHSVILTPNSANSLLFLRNGVVLTLKGIVLAKGRAPQIDDTSALTRISRGGAIINDGGVLRLESCVFSNNVAQATPNLWTTSVEVSGGAIWQTSGRLVVTNCLFTRNRVISVPISPFTATLDYPAGRGGAISATGGDVEVVDSVFTANSVSGRTGAGGALYFSGGYLSVSRTRFEDNSASVVPQGGAVHVSAGQLWLQDSIFHRNVAVAADRSLRSGLSGVASGGAIHNGATAQIYNSVFLTNSTASGRPDIRGEWARNDSIGGALFSDNQLIVVNSTFVGNDASANSAFFPNNNIENGIAGTLYSRGSAWITNCSFLPGSIGSYTVRGLTSSNLTIKNSLFEKRSGLWALPHFSGSSFTDAGHNLSSDAAPFTAPTSKSNLNLRLGPLGSYGGSTPTVPLLAGSPAIDAGDNIGAPSTDQRGRARPFGASVDVGAFESSPPYTIWGQIRGYPDPTTTLTFGTNIFQVDAAGRFFVPGISPGDEITPTAEDAIFLPKPWLLYPSADGEVQGLTSFKFGSLTYFGTLEQPAFVLASPGDQIWEVETSEDLTTWGLLGTFVFGPLGTAQVTVPKSPALFLRATIQEQPPRTTKN